MAAKEEQLPGIRPPIGHGSPRILAYEATIVINDEYGDRQGERAERAQHDGALPLLAALGRFSVVDCKARFS
jgi:hypothetical protein